MQASWGQVRLRVIWGLATLLGFFSAFQAYYFVSTFTERPASFALLLALNLNYWYGWAILVPVVLWLSRRFPNGMESRLDAGRFVRIHRSRIVNTERIKEMRPWFNGEYVVVLQNGNRLTLSRGYREKLQERLGKSLALGQEDAPGSGQCVSAFERFGPRRSSLPSPLLGIRGS